MAAMMTLTNKLFIKPATGVASAIDAWRGYFYFFDN